MVRGLTLPTKRVLKTINFEGAQAEWNAINNMSINNIPNDVTINFETSYKA